MILPEVNMNLGLISWIKGQAAAEVTGKACRYKKNLNEALGNLYIAQGQYDRAVNAFGDAKTNSCFCPDPAATTTKLKTHWQA